MPIRIEVFHHFSPEDRASLRELGEKFMAQIDDVIAHLNTSLDAVIAAATGDFASLEKRIADLQAQIDAGGTSPTALAALAAAQSKLDDLQVRLAAMPPAGGDGGPPPPGGPTATATTAAAGT